MTNFTNMSNKFLLTVTLALLISGCGGRDPILGGATSSVTNVAPLPGAAEVPTNNTIVTAAFTKATDTSAPTVTGTINANGATGVPINTNVGATFSEGMNPLTITNVSFTLMEKHNRNAVAGVVSYSGVTAVFRPNNDLAPSTEYTVTVTGAPNGVRDLAGNLMVADFVISWTTGATPDTTAPTVTGTINANGATGVPINTDVGATFSEGMDPLTITNVSFTLMEKHNRNAVAGVVSYSGVTAV
ncbi:MAG: hypothetical protein ACI9BO_001318, partial [Zhongshania sp.]